MSNMNKINHDFLSVDKKDLLSKLSGLSIKNISESNVLREVYFMLSLKCNLRCRVCSWWGIKGPCCNNFFLKNYKPNLEKKDLIRIAAQLLLLNPSRVSFSGGEPLLFKNWYLVAKLLHEAGISTSLTTNGVFIDKNCEKISEVIDDVVLSLGGPPSIIHIIRQNPRSHYEKIILGLQKITRLKGKKQNRPRLKILYTISDLSYLSMCELIEFMEERKIAVDHYGFQHLMFIDQATYIRQKEIFQSEFKIKNLPIWKGYTYKPGRMDFHKFSAEIAKLKSLFSEKISFNPDLTPEEIEPYYRFNRQILSYNRNCTAPWHQINILPNGDVYVCHDYFLGNLKKEGLSSLWNGEKAQKLRLFVAKQLFPGCKGCFYHYTDRKN